MSLLEFGLSMQKMRSDMRDSSRIASKSAVKHERFSRIASKNAVKHERFSRIVRESAEAMSLCATKYENVITEGIYGRYVRNRERSRKEISEE